MSRSSRCPVLVLLLATTGCISMTDQLGESPAVQEMSRCLSLDGTETIRLTAADPQSAVAAGVRSLAVLDFVGDARVGPNLTANLAAKLAQLGRFEVKDRASVQQAYQQVLVTTMPTADTTAKIGATLGVDAVLIGEVGALSQPDSAASLAGKDGPPLGVPLGQSGGIIETIRKDMSTHQTGMNVDFRLVSTRTGQVLLARHLTPSTSTHSLGGTNTIEPVPTPERLLLKLIDQGGDQVAAELVSPGKRTVERKIPRGSSTLNSGNMYARQGMLELAEEKYRMVADKEPKNHAALYNRGLVREALGDASAAYQFFDQARRLYECDLYVAALKRAQDAGGHTGVRCATGLFVVSP